MLLIFLGTSLDSLNIDLASLQIVYEKFPVSAVHQLFGEVVPVKDVFYVQDTRRKIDMEYSKIKIKLKII